MAKGWWIDDIPSKNDARLCYTNRRFARMPANAPRVSGGYIGGARMKRRACLKTILVGACAAKAGAEIPGHPIQLHVDLSVDPAKEQEMLHNFHNAFRPAAAKQPGFI